jgi:hypothetical protein
MEENETFEDTGIDEAIAEATDAANSLKPGAAPGDSKAETLSTFTSLLAQLGKEDLSKLFNDVQSQFGPNKVPGGAEDKSDSNKATVNMKPSAAIGKGAWKEDVDDMFSADELSEEFREKAETIFEAAVNTRINLEIARLEEQYEEKFEAELQEASEQIFEDVSGKLDQYLDYVVEQWMAENQIAIESSLRTEIAENFITGLQNLFSEHYITVPDEKVDLVAEMKAELDEVKAKLNETLDQKIELEAIINEATAISILDDVSEGLAETQVEKLRTLSEGIEYSDADVYRKKLEIIKENYFSTKSKATPTGLITESIDGSDEEVTNDVHVPAQMKQYMSAISKSIK